MEVVCCESRRRKSAGKSRSRVGYSSMLEMLAENAGKWNCMLWVTLLNGKRDIVVELLIKSLACDRMTETTAPCHLVRHRCYHRSYRHRSYQSSESNSASHLLSSSSSSVLIFVSNGALAEGPTRVVSSSSYSTSTDSSPYPSNADPCWLSLSL
jgi:hypothetical protein